MNFRIITVFFVFHFCCGMLVYADSPLTSTEFCSAYASETIIVKASETNGVLTTELMKYLINEHNPIDIKASLINKLGWNIYGRNNSKRLLSYLYAHHFKNEKDLLQNGSGDILLCVGYLRAMDNYFRVSEALKYIECPQIKNSRSYTVQIIAALIRAQRYLDQYKWCSVYQQSDKVRKNWWLKKDLKEEAVKIIFDYMDIYQHYCNAGKQNATN